MGIYWGVIANLLLLAQLLIQSIFNPKHASANNLFEILYILERTSVLNITGSQIEFSGVSTKYNVDSFELNDFMVWDVESLWSSLVCQLIIFTVKRYPSTPWLYLMQPPLWGWLFRYMLNISIWSSIWFKFVRSQRISFIVRPE